MKFFSFLFLVFSFSFSYSNDPYFLVENVDTSVFTQQDKKIHAEFLEAYHSSDEILEQLDLLNDFLLVFYEETTWVTYNDFYVELSEKAVQQKKLRGGKEYKEALQFHALALNNDGWKHDVLGNIEMAENRYRQCLSILTKHNIKEGKGIALQNLGAIKDSRGEWDSAHWYYNQALTVYKSFQDSSSIALLMNNRGGLYNLEGDLLLAYTYYDSARSIQKRIEDFAELAITLDNIGSVYLSVGDTTEALNYKNKALNYRLAQGNELESIQSYLELGRVYLSKKKLSKARNQFRTALHFANKIGDKTSIFYSNVELAHSFLAEQSYDSVMNYLRQAEKIMEELDKPLIQFELSLLKAKMAFQKKNYPLAIKEGIESLSSIQGIRADLIKKDLYFTLYESFRETGQFKNALTYFEKAIAIDDRYHNLSKRQNILASEFDRKLLLQREKDSLQSSLKLATANNKMLAHEASLQEANSRLTISLVSLGGGSLLIVLLIVANRRKVRDKKTIAKERDNAEKNYQKAEANRLQVVEKNKEIMDSLLYSKRLQEAVLPPQKLVKEWLTNSFILYKPKEVVSGDFYWMETSQIKRDDKIISLVFFAVADCTGHGVPGAMLSVICAEALNRAVNEFDLTEVGSILEKVSEIVEKILHKNEHQVNDGMDIALCGLDLGRKKLYFSGANNPVWIISRSEELMTEHPYKVFPSEFDESYKLYELKGEKKHIGYNQHDNIFQSKEIQLSPGDSIYVFSDGLADQFGGQRGKKFKNQKFRGILLEHVGKDMEQQKEAINQAFVDWKGEIEQVDDICIIGVKINGKERLNFTKRELEVLEYLNTGLPSKLIADKMEISTHTVDTYRRRMLSKTNTYNTTELINYCREKEII